MRTEPRAGFQLALAAAALTVAVAGCSRASYYLGDRTFRSPEAALRALDAELATTQSGIAPTERPIGGQVLALLPNRTRLADSGLRRRGNVQRSMVEYMVTSLEKHTDFMVDALERRTAFDHVTKRRRYETSDPPREGFDYYLWFAMHSTEAASWYLRVGEDGVRQTIPVDTGLELGAERTMGWLLAVEEAARDGSVPRVLGDAASDEQRPTSRPRTAPSRRAEDVQARLERIERMRSNGMISDDEYEAARRRILDHL